MGLLASVVLARPLIFGIRNGAALGLVAVGLVLIYKSTRVFNFAAGEFVTMGAFGVYLGEHVWHLPEAVAIIIGLVTGTLSGLITERLVVRPLANRPRVTILVATAALALVAIPLELMIGGTKFFPADPFVDGLGWKVPLADVYISPQQMLIVAALAL